MGLMGEIFYLVQQQQTGASQLNKGIGSSHISIVCKRGGGGVGAYRILNLSQICTVESHGVQLRVFLSLAGLVALVQENIFPFGRMFPPLSSCTGSMAGQ